MARKISKGRFCALLFQVIGSSLMDLISDRFAAQTTHELEGKPLWRQLISYCLSSFHVFEKSLIYDNVALFACSSGFSALNKQTNKYSTICGLLYAQLHPRSHDLMISDTGCFLLDDPEHRQKNVALLLHIHLNSRIHKLAAMKLNISRNSGGCNRQVIHSKSEFIILPDKHILVGQCCFETDSTERWYKEPYNHGGFTRKSLLLGVS